MARDKRRRAGYFFGQELFWLRPNRLYRLYASDRMLAGAYVAGQVYDVDSALELWDWFALPLWPLLRRLLARRREREARHDAADPFSPRFLELDRRNFYIPREHIRRARLRRGWLWARSHSGLLELELLSGPARRFVLVGEQDVQHVREILTKLRLEIE
jgi:hypothetical protein